MRSLDDEGNPYGATRLVAGQIGQKSGVPPGFNPNDSTGVASDLFSSGDHAFYLRQPAISRELIPMQLETLGTNNFKLTSSIGVSIEAIVGTVASSAPLTTNLEIGTESMLGLSMAGDALIGPISGPTRSIAITIDLYREASFSSRMGLYLADRSTGAVLDPLTGTFVSAGPVDENGKPITAYLNAAVANAIWQGSVQNLGHSTVSRTFVVDSSLNLDGMVILPFIDVDDPAGRQTYISGMAGNSDGAAHISLLGKNVFGFEDLARGGDNDFNDLIAAVRSISLI
jgi:hypothetical protein